MSKKYNDDVIRKMAEVMLENQYSLRQVAKEFDVGKSTAYDWMSWRLRGVDRNLYKKVLVLLYKNGRLGGKAKARKSQKNKE